MKGFANEFLPKLFVIFLITTTSNLHKIVLHKTFDTSAGSDKDPIINGINGHNERGSNN